MFAELSFLIVALSTVQSFRPHQSKYYTYIAPCVSSTFAHVSNIIGMSVSMYSFNLLFSDPIFQSPPFQNLRQPLFLLRPARDLAQFPALPKGCLTLITATFTLSMLKRKQLPRFFPPAIQPRLFEPSLGSDASSSKQSLHCYPTTSRNSDLTAAESALSNSRGALPLIRAVGKDVPEEPCH